MSGDRGFDAALQAIRDGADCKLGGLTLTVNGIALSITDEQFDVAWDAMDERGGGTDMIRLVDSDGAA